MPSYQEQIALRDRNERLLIANMVDQREELHRLLAEAQSHWGYEDPIYRFYHQSFKVVFLQLTTEKKKLSVVSYQSSVQTPAHEDPDKK